LEEWSGARSKRKGDAEKALRQFTWCIPVEPDEIEVLTLDPDELRKRDSGFRRGIVPPNTIGISIGVDTHKRFLAWQAIAHRENGGTAIIEYDTHEVDSGRLGIRNGLIRALEELREYLEQGWRDQAGVVYAPTQVWIDSGYSQHTNAVYAFCKAANAALGLKARYARYRPTKGYGEKQVRMSRYIAPRKTTDSDVRVIGDNYHLSLIKRAAVLLVHVNSDHWKSELHQGLAMPADEPLAILPYKAPSQSEHDNYFAQIMAESQRETWIDGRGSVTTWHRDERENHQLDAGYLAMAAGHLIRSSGTKEAATVGKKRRQSMAELATAAGKR